jgi:hypothetical protein
VDFSTNLSMMGTLFTNYHASTSYDYIFLRINKSGGCELISRMLACHVNPEFLPFRNLSSYTDH